MSCERFHAALVAHAAGGSLDPASAGHRATCAACRELLAARQRTLAELDAELQRTLSISASPEFTARVIAAAADTGGARRCWPISRPVLAGLGLAAAIVLTVWVQRPPIVGREPVTSLPLKPEATQSEGVARPVPHVASTGSRVDPATTVLGTALSSSKIQPTPRRPSPRLSEPPVIVDPGRALAIQRLRELNAQGRLDGAVLPPPTRPEPAVGDLSVVPLELADIPVPDVEIVNRVPAAPQQQ